MVPILIIFFILVRVTTDDSARQTIEQQQTKQTENPVQEDKKKIEQQVLPSYEVVRIEKRRTDYFVYQVLVKEQANRKQLEQLGQEIVKEAKKKDNFRELTIFLNDSPEYIDQVAALGKIEYSTNDDSFSYAIEEKDWSKRLTPEEFELWKQCRSSIDNERKVNKDIYDNDIIEKFAKQRNISADKIFDIFSKQYKWLYNT
ncbi:hypothetical protein PIPA1_38420 [Pelosinus sp. IPA-1]|nr:hypothetical protein PIPA1_38420 [Pelosinus sp. IPA-1]